MACFSVFHADKQIKVFPYMYSGTAAKEVFSVARDFATLQHENGYPCTIEEFSFSDLIGTLVYNTATPEKYRPA